MIGRINRRTVIATTAIIAGVMLVAVLMYGVLVNRARVVAGQCQDVRDLSRIPEFSPAIDFLPKSGTDVRYLVKPSATFFEVSFLCSEEQFLEWAASQGWSQAEIQETSKGAIFVEYCGIGPGMLRTLRDAYYLRTLSEDGERSPREARLMIFDPRQGRAWLQLYLHWYAAGNLVNDVSQYDLK